MNVSPAGYKEPQTLYSPARMPAHTFQRPAAGILTRKHIHLAYGRNMAVTIDRPTPTHEYVSIFLLPLLH